MRRDGFSLTVCWREQYLHTRHMYIQGRRRWSIHGQLFGYRFTNQFNPQAGSRWSIEKAYRHVHSH